MGLIAVLLVVATMPYVRSRASLRDIDWLGAAVLSAGLVPLMIALSITRDHAWTSPEVLALLAFAGAMLVSFFFVERRSENPIVPFALFKNSTFSVSMIVGFISGFGMFGTIIFVPLVYQGVLGVTATNSGQLLTPMMLGLIVASTIVGQAMVRIRYYRFLGTAGIAVMLVGMWLLSQVTVSTSRFEVVRDIVIVGAGLGSTFPLYLTAVQSALPRQFLGVASSQVQFWRQIGGTLGTAILGAVLSQRLSVKISEQLGALHLPSQALRFVPSGGNPQSIFDPTAIAARRAQAAALGPQGAAIFDNVLHAIRAGLAATLHEVFLYGAAILVLALIASVFLNDVPLRGRVQQQPGEEGAPIAAA